MNNSKINKETTQIVKTVTLELTAEEAQFLVDLLGFDIVGSGASKAASSGICSKLKNLGITNSRSQAISRAIYVSDHRIELCKALQPETATDEGTLSSTKATSGLDIFKKNIYKSASFSAKECQSIFQKLDRIAINEEANFSNKSSDLLTMFNWSQTEERYSYWNNVCNKMK